MKSFDYRHPVQWPGSQYAAGFAGVILAAAGIAPPRRAGQAGLTLAVHLVTVGRPGPAGGLTPAGHGRERMTPAAPEI
jgi:hypothetical protein